MGRAKLRFTTDGDYKAVEMCNGERLARERKIGASHPGRICKEIG
jgi:hypothetical protein